LKDNSVGDRDSLLRCGGTKRQFEADKCTPKKVKWRADKCIPKKENIIVVDCVVVGCAGENWVRVYLYRHKKRQG
jgi:hypothetical protein